jgi:hypothetical protein
MNEFNKDKSFDALVAETIVLNKLESLVSDITAEEKTLTALQEDLANAREQPITVENAVMVDDIKQKIEAQGYLLALRYQDLADLMDVQGFADNLSTQ